MFFSVCLLIGVVLSMIGKNIKAGVNLEIKGIDEKAIFSIKDVKHDFSLSGYTISVNFEG